MARVSDIEASSLLGDESINFNFTPNSRQIFRICLNLKYLIDRVIPITFKEEDITNSNSPILNKNVIDMVYRAAGGKGDGRKGTSSYKYQAALVFCLLKVCDWYWQQADNDMTESELYSLRATTAQHLAALVIDTATDDHYLILGMLCHRYSIMLNGAEAEPISALEMAVDMHCTRVIGSDGYQRCIKWLWRGWVGQSSTDPYSYEMFKGVALSSIRAHFDPARVKTPYYQNCLEIFFSVVHLVLFTIILNAHYLRVNGLNVFEILFYLFTLGSVIDELEKFYHVGWNYLGFWNVFNDLMYSIIIVAVTLRFLSLNSQGPLRARYDEISFRILSCASPFMWTRLLLYLDAQKFVGAMIVVLKTMMKESIIFFVLLLVVIIGFLQGFLGLDASDGKSEATKRILTSLVKAVVGGSDFDFAKELVPPYAAVLYYVYTFLLSVILMNILIALYTSAYTSIVDNAIDEYFALVAQKTLRYIRAPDQDLYVPPLNLIELAISPLGLILSKWQYKKLNYYTMLIIYSPILIYVSAYEITDARRIQYNRARGLPDDANEIDTEWDLTDGFPSDYNGYFDSDESQFQARQTEVLLALRDQREGELQDLEFRYNMMNFEKDVDKVAQPVEKANRAGIKWEYYQLYLKIEDLTTLVESVVNENKHLKEKLNGKGEST